MRSNFILRQITPKDSRIFWLKGLYNKIMSQRWRNLARLYYTSKQQVNISLYLFYCIMHTRRCKLLQKINESLPHLSLRQYLD